MKYITALLTGVLSVVLFSFVLSPYISEVYSNYNNIQPGPDGEAELANFLIFYQWPIFFILGVICGYMVHQIFLTKSSSGR